MAFRTGTKMGVVGVSLGLFSETKKAVSSPMVAIGGINAETLPSSSRINRATAISEIMGSEDAKGMSKELINFKVNKSKHSIVFINIFRLER